MSQKKKSKKSKKNRSAVNKPYRKQSAKQMQLTRKIEAALAKTKAPKPKAPKPKAPKAPKPKAPKPVNLMAVPESISARVDAAIAWSNEELKMLYKLRDQARTPEDYEIYQRQIDKHRYIAVKKRKIRGAQAVNLIGVEETMPTMGFGERPTKHHYTREEWAILHNPAVQDNVISYLQTVGILPPEDLAAATAAIRALDHIRLRAVLEAWSPQYYKTIYDSSGIVPEDGFTSGGIQQLMDLLGVSLTSQGQEAALYFDEQYDTHDTEKK